MYTVHTTWYNIHNIYIYVVPIYTRVSIYIYIVLFYEKYVCWTLKNLFRNEKTEDKTGKPCTYDRLPIVPNAYIIKMSSPTNNTGMHVENIVLIWEAIVYIIIILCIDCVYYIVKRFTTGFNVETQRWYAPTGYKYRYAAIMWWYKII